MKKRILGRTEMLVHPLVFGTLPLGPLQAKLPLEEGASLIRRALEAGVNLLDTAELYDNYAYLRRALDGFGGEVFLATKTHASDAPTARQHVERALRELAVENLDIVHLHGARLADPFVERADVFEELLKMKSEGKIRSLGLSSHYICAVRKAASHPEVDVIHPLINQQGMGILDGGAQEMAEAIAEAARAGKGVYAMKALAGGNLISSARSSLRYVLNLPGVHAVAVGMLSADEIEANLGLFSGQSEDDSLWQRLCSRKRQLKIMENFCKGCGACLPACASDALELCGGRVRLAEDKCILCGYCAAACPEFIIRVV